MTELVDLRKIRITSAPDAGSDISTFTEAMTDLVTIPSSDKVNAIAGPGARELLTKIVANQKKAETISRHTIYDSVFGDYLSVVPSVKYKKVRLSKLSLGQKATVLIKIYLAQGENPIVIDSHDDHLDNEFIMDELVSSLREAKQYAKLSWCRTTGTLL